MEIVVGVRWVGIDYFAHCGDVERLRENVALSMLGKCAVAAGDYFFDRV